MQFKKPPVQSWEAMKDFKDAVGPGTMQKIFSCGQTQINRYCRNPKFTADSERNPLDRLRILLEEAQEAGALEAVLAALEYIVEPLGLEVIKRRSGEPDKCVMGERLDDHSKLGKANMLMDEEEHPNLVDRAFNELFEDCNQTKTAYRREWERKNKVVPQ